MAPGRWHLSRQPAESARKRCCTVMEKCVALRTLPPSVGAAFDPPRLTTTPPIQRPRLAIDSRPAATRKNQQAQTLNEIDRHACDDDAGQEREGWTSIGTATMLEWSCRRCAIDDERRETGWRRRRRSTMDGRSLSASQQLRPSSSSIATTYPRLSSTSMDAGAPQRTTKSNDGGNLINNVGARDRRRRRGADCSYSGDGRRGRGHGRGRRGAPSSLEARAALILNFIG